MRGGRQGSGAAFYGQQGGVVEAPRCSITPWRLRGGCCARAFVGRAARSVTGEEEQLTGGPHVTETQKQRWKRTRVAGGRDPLVSGADDLREGGRMWATRGEKSIGPNWSR